MSGGVGRGVFGAWKWYNIRCFMGEKTQENSVMGYSAAYPTGAERCLRAKDIFLISLTTIE